MNWKSDMRKEEFRKVTISGERYAVAHVEYGLHFIERNQMPYFSVTFAAAKSQRKYDEGNWDYSGAGHEAALALMPEVADLVRLHLAEIDGAPIHAVANGWYWYSNYDGKGIKLYPSQSYYSLTPHERAARHLRIEPERLPQGLSKAEFVKFVETLRPEWKAEADAAIAHHELDAGER